MIYKSKKSKKWKKWKKWKGSLQLALMHTPHLDSHKHPRTDGGGVSMQPLSFVHICDMYRVQYSLLLPQP